MSNPVFLPTPYRHRSIPPQYRPDWLQREFVNVEQGVVGNIVTQIWPYAIQSYEVGVVDQRYPFGDVRRYGGLGDGTTDDRDAFANADTSVTGRWYITVPDGTWRIASDLTLASPVWPVNALLSPDVGATVTLGSPLWNPPVDQQIFATDGGDFVFGTSDTSPGQTIFRPEWVGVVLDDGTAAYSGDPVKITALLALAYANSAAMQKLADWLPGSGSTDLYQLRRQKSVIFRPGYYTFRETVTWTTRRVMFAPEVMSNQFSTVVRCFSWSSDPDGLNEMPVWHFNGNASLDPLYRDVAGEISVMGLYFDAAPNFSTVNPILQCGGKYQGGTTFSAQGASPITGINIISCGFGQVFAQARFTYCGQSQFVDNLLDGGYYGVLITQGVQELDLWLNQWFGTVYPPVQIECVGLMTNAGGSTVTNTRWIGVRVNRHDGVMNYSTFVGGLSGCVRGISDGLASNKVYDVDVDDNRWIGIGNIMEAHFGETKSAPIWFDDVDGLRVSGNNLFQEFLTPTDNGLPVALTHWDYLVVAGGTSDHVYVDPQTTWDVSRDAAAIAAGTAWYSVPSGMTATDLPGYATITLADAATFDFPDAFTDGRLTVRDTTSNESADVLVNAAIGCEIGTQSAGAEFTTTLGTPGSTNIAFNASAIRLENLTGGTATYRVLTTYNAPRGNGTGV